MYKKRKPKSNGLICESYVADGYFYTKIVNSNLLLFNWNTLRIDLVADDWTASFYIKQMKKYFYQVWVNHQPVR